MKIIILALCFAGVLAPAPPPCESPLAFEGNTIRVHPSKKFDKFSRISYDANNKRVLFRTRANHQKDHWLTKHIILYSENVQYTINMTTRACKRRTIDEPFYPIGVFSDADFTSAAYIGSSVRGSGVLVNIFDFQDKHVIYTGTFTQKGCIPVSVSYGTKKNGLNHISYYDITLGISDPNIFTPPEECFK